MTVSATRLKPDLTLGQIANKLDCDLASAREFCRDSGYEYVDGRTVPHSLIFGDKKKLDRYRHMNWSLGISELSRKTGLSRQWLTETRRQVLFYNLFHGRKRLSWKEAAKAVPGLKYDEPYYGFIRLCRVLGIVPV